MAGSEWVIDEIASGLLFPEGPVVIDDDNLLVVEMARGTLTRVQNSGKISVISELGGGPNGAAIGPDGKCYVCNNGGVSFRKIGNRFVPGSPPADYEGGYIEVVDLYSGKSERLYEHCDGVKLKAPNDIVFDSDGGFWFTDLGKSHKGRRERDYGAVYYAKTDGSEIKEVIYPLEGPNGVGLSPNQDVLYVAESTTGRLWAFDLEGNGQLRDYSGLPPWKRGRLHWVGGYYSMLDSLCIDDEGYVYVGDIPYGGISIINPSGNLDAQIITGDDLTTNACFGGQDLRTLYITCSSTGRLISTRTPRQGLPLNYS